MLSSSRPPATADLNLEVLRTRSKALFGNMDRLLVAVAIADNPDRAINATDLGWQLRLANNRVRAQLVAFAEAGLLEVPSGGTGDRKRWYLRVDSPFWDACRNLAAMWSE
jgi:hypothetical protein